MQRRLLPNIIILLRIRIGPIFKQNFHKIGILVHNSNMEGGAAIDIPAIDIGFFV